MNQKEKIFRTYEIKYINDAHMLTKSKINNN